MFARTNCTDAVIMLGGAADSADERRHLMPGFAGFYLNGIMRKGKV